MTRVACLAALFVLAACKSAGDPTTSTVASASAKPKPTAHGSHDPLAIDPTKANVVELRDRRTAARSEHDVVFRLVREGAEFAWTAKGTAVGTLGERVPDPAPILKSPYAKDCQCGVDVRCDCESAGENDAIVQKTGRVPAAKVEAFLALVAGKTTTAAPADGGAPLSGLHTAHLVAFWPDVDSPVHASRFADGWLRDGSPIAGTAGDAGANPDVDAAWTELLAALDVPNWDKVLNPPPPAALPPDFADLAKAQTVEVFDGWNGLGATHGMVARLERTATGFAMKAKVTPDHDGVQESILDPWDPKRTSHYVSCRCALDVLCECDHGAKLQKGNVAKEPVEAFLAEVARHGLDPAPFRERGYWTDDYPRGHVIVWTRAGAAPIHLSFLDQQRQWRANGRELAPDPAPAKPSSFEIQHAVINAAYTKMLTAIGLDAWRKTLGGRGAR